MSVIDDIKADERPDSRFDQPKRKGRPGRLPPEGSGAITKRITLLAVIAGIVMAAGKFWLFVQTGSVGIMASLVHSALDITGALSSFVAVRYAVKRPDEKYSFGRGKAESFSAVFQVCLIVFAAFHLLEAVFANVSHGHSHVINQSGLAIFTLSLFVIMTFWLIIAQSWAVRATGSIAVRGDRAHYMADLFANIFVILGVAITSFTPFIWADALVGGILAIWLLYTAFKVARLAWAQLMDMELNEDECKSLTRLAMQDPSVRAVHDLRTRASGPYLHVQMRLDLDQTLSLSEAHDIILAAEARMMATFPAADILIHPHPAGCEHSHGNHRFRSPNSAQD